MKQLNNKKGFTLIEVVLVLAIGGLIFLLAFVAFQQVSTNRRDTQRRSVAGSFIAELQNYYSDNRSYPNAPANTGYWSDAIPASATDGLAIFVKSYMGGPKLLDPKGQAIYVTNGQTSFDYVHALGGSGRVILYGFEKKCNGTALDSGTTSGSVAVLFSLEKGVACRDSQS